ncbi:MAG: regulatory protein RecX [Elusimicrobiota bacterium]
MEKAALAAAVKFLAARARGEAELAGKLLKKGFAPEAVRFAVDRLKNLRYLDDAALARDAAERGRDRGEADLLIRLKLEARGVEVGAARRALAEDAPAESESDRARRALRKRAARLKSLAPAVQRRRLGGYLARLGYTPECIEDVLEEHFADQTAGD